MTALFIIAGTVITGTIIAFVGVICYLNRETPSEKERRVLLYKDLELYGDDCLDIMA